MNRKGLSFLCALLLPLALPTVARAVDDPPGVCWQYTVERSIGSDRLPEPEANYCLHLRWGVVNYLRLGKPYGALDHFAAAYKAAGEFPPGEQRARAQDEARVAFALALEAMGRVSDALTLIQQKNEAQRDVVALARGSMLARHLPVEKSGPALDAFQVARAALPDHWTDKVEATASALAARKAGKDVPFPSGIAHFYLPSYLPDRPPAGMESKCGCTNEGTAPLSFHAANATRDMADYIIAMQQRFGDSPHRQWVLIGHADAGCKPGRQAQCRADNLELSRQRAEQARLKLLGELAARGVANLLVIIEYHGMEQPLEPQEAGRSWKPNRRLQLVWRDKNAVEATTSCPWRLSLFPPGAAEGPGSTGQPLDAGKVIAPDRVLRVASDTGFTIQFQPDHAPAGITHVYAFSEDAAGNVADLLALAGRAPEMAAAGLFQQPRLPAQDHFHLDPGSKRERISLYLSKGPVPALEALRASPVSASTNPNLAALPRAVIADGQGRLADLMPGGKAGPDRGLSPPFDRLFHSVESVPSQAIDDTEAVTCSFNLDQE